MKCIGYLIKIGFILHTYTLTLFFLEYLKEMYKEFVMSEKYPEDNKFSYMGMQIKKSEDIKEDEFMISFSKYDL